MTLDVMSSPQGLGFWIAFPRLIHGGSPNAIASALKRVGAGWVAPRLPERDGNTPTGWTIEHTEACYLAGIDVRGWIYVRPGWEKRQAETVAKHVDSGMSGFIFNDELPYIPQDVGKYAENRYNVRLLRKVFRERFPDLWLASAPLPLIGYHPGHTSEVWMEPCEDGAPFLQAILIQTYGPEVGMKQDVLIRTALGHWSAVAAKLPVGTVTPPVVPIGATYGRGDIARLKAGQLPPREIALAEIGEYLDWPGLPFRSLYSLDACWGNAATVDYLAARHRGVMYSPPQDYEVLGVDPLWGAEERGSLGWAFDGAMRRSL